VAGGTAWRKSWHAAPATWSLAALTALVWLVAFSFQRSDVLIHQASFLPQQLGATPDAGVVVPAWLTPITTLFVHDGFAQLALNLLALIAYGRAVEPAVGTVGFLILYLAGAIAAAAAFYLVHPVEIGLYWAGAGGGVGALLGAYAVLFGSTRVRPKARLARWTYALWLCLGWTLLSMLVMTPSAGIFVIYYPAALVASFAAGLLLGRPLLLFRYRGA
jgi:membrane associated rhomboid family serine protease